MGFLMGKWWENDGKMMGTWWENDGKMMGKWWENDWLVVVWNMFYFPFHIWDIILPIDELIFFKMVIAPPTRWCLFSRGLTGFGVMDRQQFFEKRWRWRRGIWVTILAIFKNTARNLPSGKRLQFANWNITVLNRQIIHFYGGVQ